MNHEKRISRLPNAILSTQMCRISKINDDDRISKLPDAILSKIISFLDLKSAIRTSILSNRWMPLWTFLEDFDFDYDEYQNSRYPSFIFDGGYRKAFVNSYLRFVGGVLSNRDHSTKIGKFRLAFNKASVDPIFIQNCVNYAISHNVEDLYLGFFGFSPKPSRWTLNIFESRSLYKLTLKYNFRGCWITPKLFCLPSLKILYLECFEFKDEDDYNFSKEPFSCFPNLEELTLDCCKVDGLTIIAPELLVLELLFRGYELEHLYESKILKVATPKLESFMFEGHVSLVCLMEELPSLDTVFVNFYSRLFHGDNIIEKMQINLFELLEQLKYAKTLTISFTTIKFLSRDLDVLQQYPSPFVNLKYLKFVNKPWEKLSDVQCENVMAYLTSASSFGDSIIVENHDFDLTTY